jgi:hypothetical protein
MKRFLCITILTCSGSSFVVAQQKANDVTAPLHALQPDYAVPYNIPTEVNIKICWTGSFIIWIL